MPARLHMPPAVHMHVCTCACLCRRAGAAVVGGAGPCKVGVHVHRPLEVSWTKGLSASARQSDEGVQTAREAGGAQAGDTQALMRVCHTRAPVRPPPAAQVMVVSRFLGFLGF
jgi:hypothetical protein